MVMFRDFVQRKTRALGLQGYAQNMTDGSLYVVAQGEEEHLQKLIEHLHKGPFLAKVARVDVEWGELEEPLSGFHIRY